MTKIYEAQIGEQVVYLYKSVVRNTIVVLGGKKVLHLPSLCLPKRSLKYSFFSTRYWGKLLRDVNLSCTN